LTGDEKLTLDISSFSNGRIVLDVTTDDDTLDLLMAGISEILNLLPVILKIRNIQTEIAHLPVNCSLSELLEEEIQTLINQKAWDSAQKLISDHLKGASFSDELTNDISRSLKQILSYVEKGGKIEFKPLRADSGNAEINKILIESFSIAHELENVTDSFARATAEKDRITDYNESEASDDNIAS